MHIRNHNDLIKWLEENAPRRAIARAVLEGQVENLGAFEEVASFFRPGWIVKVISKYKTVWFVTIFARRERFACFVRTATKHMDDVPWKNWIGEFANNKLYQGDNPLQYKELRDNEKRATSNS